jgi:hypothetical protein
VKLVRVCETELQGHGRFPPHFPVCDPKHEADAAARHRKPQRDSKRERFRPCGAWEYVAGPGIVKRAVAAGVLKFLGCKTHFTFSARQRILDTRPGRKRFQLRFSLKVFYTSRRRLPPSSGSMAGFIAGRCRSPEHVLRYPCRYETEPQDPFSTETGFKSNPAYRVYRREGSAEGS